MTSCNLVVLCCYWYNKLTYLHAILRWPWQQHEQSILLHSSLHCAVQTASRIYGSVHCSISSSHPFLGLLGCHQVLLLFNISWTSFTGSKSVLRLTSKSLLWLTRLLSSGHPAYLHELISPYQPSRSLRSSNQLLLTVPRANLTIGQRAFSYSSPVIWNTSPLSVRDTPSISTFKCYLKSFYFHSLVS